MLIILLLKLVASIVVSYGLVKRFVDWLSTSYPGLRAAKIEADGWRHYLPLFDGCEAVMATPLMFGVLVLLNGLHHFGLFLALAAVSAAVISIFVFMSLCRRFPAICPECNKPMFIGPTPKVCSGCHYEPKRDMGVTACVG